MLTAEGELRATACNNEITKIKARPGLYSGRKSC